MFIEVRQRSCVNGLAEECLFKCDRRSRVHLVEAVFIQD